MILSVATAYFQLRELDIELEIAQRTLASRKESLQLTQTLERGGAAGLLDVRQAEQLVETAAETIPETRTPDRDCRRICSARSSARIRTTSRGAALLPISRAANRSRPVCRRVCSSAVRTSSSRAATDCSERADRCRARAVFSALPADRQGGVESGPLSKLFTPGAGAWTFTAPLTQPIFTAGKLQANLKLAEAQQQQALLTYQQTIQTRSARFRTR